jgi:uncharacterized protein (TIGR02271 family)
VFVNPRYARSPKAYLVVSEDRAGLCPKPDPKEAEMPERPSRTIAHLVDCTVVDQNDQKIGRIADVYLDRDTNTPEWALVHTGLFGTRSTLVPLATASPHGDDLAVPYDKDFVKDAPNVDIDEELSQDDERVLAEYYSLRYSEERSSSGLPEGSPGGRGRSTGAGDAAMTRSEEEVRIETARRPSELVRLKKHVVTEQQQVTVPVQHEEVRVERTPIADAGAAQGVSDDISEDQEEMVLQEEVVDVSKRVVPKERVRLEKDLVTEDQTVSEEVRKERIDVEREPRRSS